jgi:hypothetical protein
MTLLNLTRRGFLSGLAGLGGMTLVPGAGSQALAKGVLSGEQVPLGGERLARAFEVRTQAARLARERGAARTSPNGDEDGVPRLLAVYSKALPHNALGEVDPNAYAVLLRALRSGKHKDFESIPLGRSVKLANPQAALAFELLGPDGCQPSVPAPPGFSSAEQAAEMVELYWQALLRDISFLEYDTHPLVEQAAEELSRLPGFHGPRQEGRVTPRTLFRGLSLGNLEGPYVSQFLWKTLPLTPVRVEQRLRTVIPGADYLTRYDEWLRIQNGSLAGVNQFDTEARYIRNGRDLGEYVHRDYTYQAFLGACLAALKMGVLPDGGNPYKHSRTQSAFVTFGQPYLFYLLAVVTQAALKACWFQKWIVHRRLRPEEFGGRVENHLRKKAAYPFFEQLLDSRALVETRQRFGSGLLAQAYPEGCPTHPSYPAGHAVIAGACATVLKACLDEAHILPGPVMATADGRSLMPYQGPDLTVGGELDKLASNIALGRDFAGVHWRSDCIAGLRLGEEVTIAVLEELRLTGNEQFQGWNLRRFDGTRVSVG